MDAHAAMQQKGRRCAERVRASNAYTSAQADAMVKGQDRAPTDLIDSLVDVLTKRTFSQRATITNSLWIFGAGASFALVALIGASP